MPAKWARAVPLFHWSHISGPLSLQALSAVQDAEVAQILTAVKVVSFSLFRHLLCQLHFNHPEQMSLLFWRHSIVLHTSELDGFLPCEVPLASAASVVCISPVFSA